MVDGRGRGPYRLLRSDDLPHRAPQAQSLPRGADPDRPMPRRARLRTLRARALDHRGRGDGVTEKLVLTPREAARISGLGRDFVYEALHDGRIRSIRRGRNYLIPRSE